MSKFNTDINEDKLPYVKFSFSKCPKCNKYALVHIIDHGLLNAYFGITEFTEECMYCGYPNNYDANPWLKVVEQ